MVKHINDVLIHLPNKSHFSFKSGNDFLYILFYLPLRFYFQVNILLKQWHIILMKLKWIVAVTFSISKKKKIIKDLWKKTISKDVCLVNIDSVWVLRYQTLFNKQCVYRTWTLHIFYCYLERIKYLAKIRTPSHSIRIVYKPPPIS